MAHENIRLKQPNFCIGPQAGTICTIDTTNPTTILRVKNTTGATIIDLSLSSNILNDDIRVEYVGPNNLSDVVDDLTFFTFEKVSNTSCMVKRWATRMAYSELLLKEQVIKSTTGNEHYNALDFAVEYYYRHFTRPNENYNYLEMDSTANVKNGTRLFFGPSTDTDNIGATEAGVVSHIINHIDGKRVYLTAPLKYQYAIGDLITFYSHVYIYSSVGYAGDTTRGSLFKIDAYTWDTVEIDAKAFYKKVTASRWCPMVGGIASIVNANMLFVRPYDYYLNWRSMFMNNILDDKNTIFPVYDVIFDNFSIYKLQKRTTLQEDDGTETTYFWSTYNFQQDSLLPYTASMTTWLEKSILIGYHQNVDIYTQVRDQFHVGLRDVYVSFYKQGDDEALYDPLSGNVTTDLNGKTSINYRSGSIYKGHTEISAKATGGSTSAGSAFIWAWNNVISLPETDPVNILAWQVIWDYYRLRFKQINMTYMVWKPDLSGESGEWALPRFNFIGCKSFFTTPGGHWGPGDKVEDYEPDYGQYSTPETILEWLPMLYRGEDQIDGIAMPTGGYGFTSGWPWDDLPQSPQPYFIGNNITLFNDIEAESKAKTLTDFLLYPKDGGVTSGYVPRIRVLQPEEDGNGQISQLKLSLHTHWVDGQPYDELWTYSNIDQFIFVEDAVPKFWSSKNPIETNIWIRLRPFAFSLDNETLRMWVREDSYAGDTGYIEVTDLVDIVNFDAGGGSLGIELDYDPPQDFKYGSTVYVRIEVYDTAYIPNFVYVEYWFKVIPDYKAPFILNMNPDHGDIDVPVDKPIYLEIEDYGTGIDRSTLEILINSRRMDPDYVTVEEVSRYHYNITYTPPEGLYFSKSYKITAKVQDTSPRQNAMNSSYEFFTADSTGVLITDPTPGPCKGGMARFEEVSALVLGDGNGVDKGTIRMQVYNRDINPRVVPIVYRIS
jgi:hypothetical protein